MKGWIGLVVLGVISGSAFAEAPFCVVTSGTSSCFYYDVQSCQQAAKSMKGLCTANPRATQSQGIQTQQTQQSRNSSVIDAMSSVYRAGQEGEEAGIRRRQAREQSELNRLQQQALRQQIAQRNVSAAEDPAGKALGEVVVSARALHRACGLAQALAGPAGMKLSEDEATLGFACSVYAQGAYAAALLSEGFTSPDKSIRFCTPRSGSSPQSLIDAIVSIGDQNQQLVASGVSTRSLLIAALSSLSSCPPAVR